MIAFAKRFAVTYAKVFPIVVLVGTLFLWLVFSLPVVRALIVAVPAGIGIAASATFWIQWMSIELNEGVEESIVDQERRRFMRRTGGR